ncbi:MAG: phosphoribosylaminoimidazolesuccinocarboxamide synthase [Bryobacteraceae bacterium]
MCNDPVVVETEIDLPLMNRGKVRDIYDLGQTLLFVATDRISAFDCILGSGIPCKGRVLTQISLFWFDRLKNLVPSHVVTADPEQYPLTLRHNHSALAGRSMIVRKAAMIPVECVARGYLSGSGWKEYRATGTVCGIKLPAGLKESDRLPEPIFTPATKAQSGHDENVSFNHVASTIGDALAIRLRDLTLAIYRAAAAYALERGLILADTKFEFGFIGDELVLADEVLTPDSSRYWPANDYSPGRPQLSFDKQFVRDYLETLRWNKQPPAPSLPQDIVDKTKQKYVQAFERLTGRAL